MNSFIKKTNKKNILKLMGKQILDKHIKYHKYYKPNTTYWGLGIENEFYLQFETQSYLQTNNF